MPTANKAKNVFDNGKTNSYHIKSIADCQQSAKSSAFKLILARGSRNKRYDFEADNPKIAGMCLLVAFSLSWEANVLRCSGDCAYDQVAQDCA